MEENNFEKQVQETLADLTIQPSEKTWTGIESRIGKRDSSKKILWFLLINFFLLTGGGYLFWQNGQANQQLISNLPTQKSETGKQQDLNDQRNSTFLKKEEEQISFKEKDKDQVVFDNKSTGFSPISGESNTLPEQQHTQNIEMTKQSGIKEKMGVQKEVAKTINKIGGIEQKNNNVHRESGAFSANVSKDSTAKPGHLTQNEIDTLSFVKKDSLIEILAQKKSISEIEPELISKDSNEEGKSLQNEKIVKTTGSPEKKWEIGVTFSAAKASLGEGIQLGLKLDKSAVATDPQNSYNYSYSRPGNSVDQNRTGPAASPEHSYGFNTGVVLKKDISPKTTFVTGLGYTYYTNSMLVGDELPGEKYSSAGILTSFRNNLHFIDLPIQLQFNLNRKHKIPLNITAGVNVSQLVASNALQYKNGYYEIDNSLFNKTQLAFNAGFSATLFRKLSVGPFYRYGLNSLAGEGIYGRKQLNFLGLRAALTLNINK